MLKTPDTLYLFTSSTQNPQIEGLDLYTCIYMYLVRA